MKRPYVGVTGFTNQADVLSVLDEIPDSSERKLMVGVLASQKTIFLGQQAKFPNRYPSPEVIAGIFPDHPSALNLIYYATKKRGSLFDQMLRIADLAGPNFHGFQLNMCWPPSGALYEYRIRYPRNEIVLQVGNRAFEAVDHSPRDLAYKVFTQYAGLIDYVLLDLSGGFGRQLDTAHMKEFLEGLRHREIEMFAGLGVAGGLSATTLDLVEPFVDEFPMMSIDAESSLRDKNDNLDIEAAKAYVKRAMQVFSD